MPQTVGGISLANVVAEISANGSAWTDVSGNVNTVAIGGGGRKTGEAYTASGDTAVITAGKRQPLIVTLKAIYSEINTEIYEVLRAIFEAGTPYWFRYSPKGGASTTYRFTASAAGYLTDAVYPEGAVDDGKPVEVSFNLKVPSLVKSVVP